MPVNRTSCVIIFVLAISATLIGLQSAFEAENVGPSSHELHSNDKETSGSLPKDKVLLSEVKSLTFQRNKRTTSRRTHSIPQLSCVGGTAGCKLFTTDLVECENIGNPGQKTTHINQINWQCRANIGDRVKFNHVEVICEGYDYPEDDYILLGSCGLEFTLDYSDPHDHHENSYFHRMDDHEKELYRQRVPKKDVDKQPHSTSPAISTTNSYLIGAMILFMAIMVVLIRYYSTSARGTKLASTVLTTKKAC